MQFSLPWIRSLWGGPAPAKAEEREEHETTPGRRSYAREASALLLIASGIYAGLALASFRADPLRPEVTGADWVGPVGAVLSHAFVNGIGIMAWLVPLELVLLAGPLLRDKPLRFSVARASGDVLIAVMSAALVHIAMPQALVLGRMPIGGVIGTLFGEVARGLFSMLGSFLVGGTVIALILVQRATFSFIALAQWLARAVGALRVRLAAGLTRLRGAWSRARAEDQKRRDEERRASEPLIASAEQADAIIAAFADAGFGEWAPAPKPPIDLPTPVMAPVEIAATPSVEAVPVEEPPAPAAEPAKRTRAHKNEEPRIVDTSGVQKTAKAKRRQVAAESRFQLPSPELLDPPIGGGVKPDEEALRETGRQLVKTLADYGVEGHVREIHPGPTVTMFEVSPAAGTKVSKVASLADNLALGLSRKVRIVAPIPGKNRIGFEVPNDQRVPVSLRDLIESRDFMEMDAPLPCVLGRDFIGKPYFADLAAMPHTIVAGATGAGKSVMLNVMLLSLLFRRSPEEMRMLMIDPKMVELAPFDRIPHLLLPVVTDMKQAANALKWAVDEMERRYQLFADAGTRNIITYNGWVKKVATGQLVLPLQGEATEPPKRLPYIVVVVEEFSDLMMTQGKEVEAAVARLAQKARAAGIHVILATQRPSVDVITGIIKANFPTRIAFRVAQRVDSRTILDDQGAEHLLGKGDMLVKMNGSSELKRVQCPFASEEDVERVTAMLRAQGEPEYDESILLARGDDEGGDAEGEGENDELYDQSVRIVAETMKCSTSWIQRKLGIGYNRAAKIVETMEKRGVIGPANGSKPRDIYVSPQ